MIEPRILRFVPFDLRSHVLETGRFPEIWVRFDESCFPMMVTAPTEPDLRFLLSHSLKLKDTTK